MKDDADPLPLRGDGVVLRRLDVSDLEAFQAYRRDTGLGRYQGWSPLLDASARAFLEEMSAIPLFRPGEWAQVGIADPASGVLLGDLGLHLGSTTREVEIGFTLARPAHGRGLATAAVRVALRLVFDQPTVERAIAVADARNRASIGVLERVGMRRLEARAALSRGEPCVELVYALGRDRA